MKVRPVLERLALELGHRFDEEVSGRYLRALTLLGERRSLSLEELLEALEARQVSWREALESTLVHETYFFRDPDQFAVVSDLALTAQREGRPWTSGFSVGCSTGEEAWSLGHTLLPSAPGATVIGFDLSTAALEVARVGRYGPRSFRAAQAERLGKEVEFLDGRAFQVGARLRSVVRFEQVNLADDVQLSALRRRQADVVFCRNVLMYLTGERARAVREALLDMVAPRGCLVLGPLDVHEVPTGFVEAKTGTAQSVFVKETAPVVVPAVVAGVPARSSVLAQARQLADRGDHQEATRLLATEPDGAEVQLLLGTMLLEQGAFSRAEFCFRRALLMAPDSVEASFRLVLVLARVGGSPVDLQRVKAGLHARLAGRRDDEELAPGLSVSMIRQALHST